MSCCHGNPSVKIGFRLRAGILAVAVFFAIVTGAGAETCKLDMKKKADWSGGERTLFENRIRFSYPQRFFGQLGGPEGMIRGESDEEKPKFSEIIKKEPAYVTEYPFRGVAKLGSHYYGYAFDAADPKKAEEENKNADDSRKKDETKAAKPDADSKKNPQPKVATYARLYFDLNRNGDLTDDGVVKAESATRRSATFTLASFPPVDLTIEADGTKMDYAFTMEVYARSSRDFAYANARLNAAVYREGELTLDGKKKRVVLADFNSNGIFSDEPRINEEIRTADGAVYPTRGDRLFVIDPGAEMRGNPYDVLSSASDCLHYVAGLVNLSGKFYDLKITASGDELTLSPSSVRVGHVTNPNEGYRAVVYGEAGFLKVVGDQEGKSPLPEGEWKLLSYTIDRTEKSEPEEAKAEKEPESPSGASAKSAAAKTAKAAARKRTGPTTVSARGKKDYKPVRVEKGKTVELPFGPPYRPVVSAQDVLNRKTRLVELDLSIVGVGGESRTDIRINGRRPEKPKFTITTKDGKEVESGVFEYG